MRCAPLFAVLAVLLLLGFAQPPEVGEPRRAVVEDSRVAGPGDDTKTSLPPTAPILPPAVGEFYRISACSAGDPSVRRGELYVPVELLSTMLCPAPATTICFRITTTNELSCNPADVKRARCVCLDLLNPPPIVVLDIVEQDEAICNGEMAMPVFGTCEYGCAPCYGVPTALADYIPPETWEMFADIRAFDSL